MKEYYVYILASESKTIYVGVTKDLKRRIFEHKEKIIEGFISKYNCEKLVYYESFLDIREAIAYEKRLKNYRRERKVNLIENNNLYWEDLYDSLA